MALKDVHDSLDEIPEQYRDLYTEKGDKWELTGISGVKTTADVERLQSALAKERNDHKQAREQLKPWADFDYDEVQQKLDRIPELEAAAKGKLDDAGIEEMVEKRVSATLKSRTAPLERENKTLKERMAELEEKANALEGEKKRRSLHDTVRKALAEHKVIPEAHEDALMLAERVFEETEDGKHITKEGVGITPGMDPAGWLSELQDRKPHWWPGSTGGGARGSGGGGITGGAGNPWSADGWNMTKQGQYLREHGREKAERMATAAGTSVGGPRPKKKGS